VVTDPRVEPYLARVEEIAVAATHELPGLLVERKAGVAVVVHWRRRPEMADQAAAWVARAAARTGLELHPAKMAAELRPPVPVDKGTVVEELGDGLVAAAFAGDDVGDLAGFDARDRLERDGRLHTLRIAVRSAEEPRGWARDPCAGRRRPVSPLLADRGPDYECACLSCVSSHADVGSPWRAFGARRRRPPVPPVS
jgi:hypothetical protein